MARFARERVRDRRDRDHGQPASARALRDLDRDRRRPAVAEDEHDVRRRELEVREDALGKTFHPLDEHRLALPIRADDLRVKRHRQLDERIEARVRAVAWEQLLDRHARMAGAERVDEPAGRDRVRAQPARRVERLRLRLQTVEQLAGAREKLRRGRSRVGSHLAV